MKYPYGELYGVTIYLETELPFNGVGMIDVINALDEIKAPIHRRLG